MELAEKINAFYTMFPFNSAGLNIFIRVVFVSIIYIYIYRILSKQAFNASKIFYYCRRQVVDRENKSIRQLISSKRIYTIYLFPIISAIFMIGILALVSGDAFFHFFIACVYYGIVLIPIPKIYYQHYRFKKYFHKIQNFKAHQFYKSGDFTPAYYILQLRDTLLWICWFLVFQSILIPYIWVSAGQSL